MKNVDYFAYGSNMDESRIKGRSVKPQKSARAVLEGYKLVFNKRATSGAPTGAGYANIVKEDGSVVEGILYTFPETQLSFLDKAEGVAGGHYHRDTSVTVKVIDSGITVENVIVYIACEDRTADKLKPTRAYLNHLLAGNLSDEYLERLRSVKTID